MIEVKSGRADVLNPLQVIFRKLFFYVSALVFVCSCHGGGDREGRGEKLSRSSLPSIEPHSNAGSNPTSALLPSFSSVIERLRDVVVTITTTQIVTRRPTPGFPFDFFSPYDYPKKREMRTGLGSGFIIKRTGYIVTNNHVIEGASHVFVKLSDRRELPAGIVGRDQRLDIAILRIPESVSSEANLGDSDKLQVGDWVIAIGNPLGLANTVTAGIVSAKGRSSWELRGEIPGYADFIQTDASINPGNSGGPLINLKGEVVGVNTAIIKGGQGIGFAIPINMVKQVLPQLIEYGSVTRAWLGIYIAPMDSDIARKLNLEKPEGAFIADIIKGGPADKAGLRPADIITEFNGRKIEDGGKLPWIIATSPINIPLKMKVIRDNRVMEFEVILSPMPDVR